MQNKTFFKTLFAVSFLALPALAQEADTTAKKELEKPQKVEATPVAQPTSSALDALGDFSDIDMSQKKTVDFPARSSLDSLEYAPLPGVFETNVKGPQPMGESVSVNDLPSEQLLGRLTPEVFQEMAELERDNAFLKLQIQKEQMKNDLENVKAQYRQNRLDEIAKREEVVRSRIQWWQEQEKLRKEADSVRQESEELKKEKAQAKALKEQLEAAKAAEAAAKKAAIEAQNQPKAEGEAVAPVPAQPIPEVEEPIAQYDEYVLLTVKGTRGNLVAKVKNLTTDAVSKVHIGDKLGDEVITAITPNSVIILRDNSEYEINFASQE